MSKRKSNKKVKQMIDSIQKCRHGCKLLHDYDGYWNNEFQIGNPSYQYICSKCGIKTKVYSSVFYSPAYNAFLARKEWVKISKPRLSGTVSIKGSGM